MICRRILVVLALSFIAAVPSPTALARARSRPRVPSGSEAADYEEYTKKTGVHHREVSSDRRWSTTCRIEGVATPKLSSATSPARPKAALLEGVYEYIGCSTRRATR